MNNKPISQLNSQFIVLFVILSILFGCSKEKSGAGISSPLQMQIKTRAVHEYIYDQRDRIKVDRKTTYDYAYGIPFDSTISETFYNYNVKGKLVNSITLPDSTRQVKIYNKQDSVIGDYIINNYGDTTSSNVTIYNNGKVIRRVMRSLHIKIPEEFDNIKKIDLRKYDTLLFITDFIYEGNTHIKSLEKDKEGEVTGEIEYYYEKQKRIKSMAYSFFGDTKYLNETTYYDTSSIAKGDFVCIGIQKDTVAMGVTTIKENGKIYRNFNLALNIQDFYYYDVKGQLLTTVSLNFDSSEKTVIKYIYDNWGSVLEETTFVDQ